MKIQEQNSNNTGDSYQCNFVLLSRKEKVKGSDEVSGTGSAEGRSTTGKKAQN